MTSHPVQLVPSDGGEPIRLKRIVTVLGGDREVCDVWVAGVWDVQCAIIHTAELLLVRGLGGPQDTQVNGQPVKERLLHPGDTLDLGGTEFRVERQADQATVAVDERGRVCEFRFLPPQILSAGQSLTAKSEIRTPDPLLALLESAPPAPETAPPERRIESQVLDAVYSEDAFDGWETQPSVAATPPSDEISEEEVLDVLSQPLDAGSAAANASSQPRSDSSCDPELDAPAETASTLDSSPLQNETAEGGHPTPARTLSTVESSPLTPASAGRESLQPDFAEPRAVAPRPDRTRGRAEAAPRPFLRRLTEHRQGLVPLAAALLVLLSVLAFQVFTADSNSDGREHVAVSGHVTVDGKPLPEGTIAFVSTTAGHTAAGQIVNVRYSLPKSDGPLVGRAKVSIFAYRKTGKKIQVELGDTPEASRGQLSVGDVVDGVVEEVEQFLPEKYNKGTLLSADLQAGTNGTVDFEIPVPATPE